MTQFQLRMTRTSACLGIAFCLCGLLLPGCLCVDWIGGFDLDVQLHSKTNQQIERAQLVAVSNLTEEGKQQLLNEPGDLGLLGKVVDTSSSSATVYVTASGRQRLWGLIETRTQFKWLFVQVNYRNGNQHRTIVGTPDGRVQRELTIDIP